MKTKIFLELCCNHNGSIKIAKDLIEQAAELKVFGIKLQKRDIDGLEESVKNQPRNLSNSFGKNYYEHRKALEFSKSEIKELKSFAEERGLKFSCSAFDLQSAKDLVEINCKWIKLPSQLLLNKEIYIYLKDKIDFKVAVSTGMHDYNEIKKSDWYYNANIVYHCVSEYPAENLNLSSIKKLNKINGYSSHEIAGRAIPYAVLMGLEYIERHFTYDKNAKGSDHKISSDYSEMKKIIEEIEYVEKILGSEDKVLSETELLNRKIYRGF